MAAGNAGAEPLINMKTDDDDDDENENAEARRRNYEELEREVRESWEMQERMREVLQRAWGRVQVLEDAEERLCSQLAHLEVEAFEEASQYRECLMDQLQLSCAPSSSVHLPSPKHTAHSASAR